MPLTKIIIIPRKSDMRILRIRTGFLFILFFSGLYLVHPTSLHAALAREDIPLTSRQKSILFQYTVHYPEVMAIDTGHCSSGRSDGAMVAFRNGMRACAKLPAHKPTQSVRAEFYSYQLAVLLGIHFVPPVVVEEMPPNADNWMAGETIVFSLFVDSLQPEYIPRTIMESRYKGEPWNIENASASERKRLEQWSTMIVLDYLTGQIDRLVSLQLVTRHDKEYSSGPVWNLDKNSDGDLVVYDNSLTFDAGGYVEMIEERDLNLLDYLGIDIEEVQKLDLGHLCYFDPVVLNRLEQLDKEEDPVAVLEEHAREDDPASFEKAGLLPEELKAAFKERIKYVLNQAEKCGAL